MPPKITKATGNKKSDDRRKTSLRSSQKGCGTPTDPVEVTNSEVDEAETTSKPDEADTILRTKDVPSQASDPGDTPSALGISHQGHQSQLHATDKETMVAAEMLELLLGTDDPNKTPPGEEAYFGGFGLLDHVCHSQIKMKGHSHQTIQQ